MAEYGLTDAGFARKPLSQIVSDLNAGMQAIFGAGADLNPDSPFGQLVGLIAGAADEVWEASEEVLTAFDPQSARGALLSSLVMLNGIRRTDGTASIVLVTCTGTPGTVIPAGTLARSASGDLFENLALVTIGGGGTTGAFFQSVEIGPVPVDAGVVNEIVTPIAGWASVSNAGAGIVGTLDESDPDLRRRREISTESGAVSIMDALIAGLRAIPSVLDALVVENKLLATDGLGVPGKSFMAVVDGGTDQDIADVVWAKHPMGIASHGSSSATVVDSEGVIQTVYFQRPAGVDIYVEMTIATTPDFPADGDELIKQAIVDFAAGVLPGYEGAGFGIGDDVLYSRLYSAINSVPGHTVSSFTIGFTPSPVFTTNLGITDAQVARFDVADIVVNT